MPTVTILSYAVKESTRRRATRLLTEWFGDHGADTTHVVVCFREVPPMYYFVGGVPPTGLSTPQTLGVSEFEWASVICSVSIERTEAYLQELAHFVHMTLGGERLAHFTCRFDQIDPSKTYYADNTRCLVMAGLEHDMLTVSQPTPHMQMRRPPEKEFAHGVRQHISPIGKREK